MTSPSHHDSSKLIESDFIVTSVRSLSTCVICLTDLWTSSFFKCFLSWSSPTEDNLPCSRPSLWFKRPRIPEDQPYQQRLRWWHYWVPLLLCVICHLIPCPVQQWGHIFHGLFHCYACRILSCCPSYPLQASTWGLPCFFAPHPYAVGHCTIFCTFLGSRALLPSLLCFVCTSEFSQALFAHPSRPRKLEEMICSTFIELKIWEAAVTGLTILLGDKQLSNLFSFILNMLLEWFLLVSERMLVQVELTKLKKIALCTLV